MFWSLMPLRMLSVPVLRTVSALVTIWTVRLTKAHRQDEIKDAAAVMWFQLQEDFKDKEDFSHEDN